MQAGDRIITTHDLKKTNPDQPVIEQGSTGTVGRVSGDVLEVVFDCDPDRARYVHINSVEALDERPHFSALDWDLEVVRRWREGRVTQAVVK